MGKYDEAVVVKELGRNPAVTFNGKTISVVKNTSLIGNSFWGRIDFLTKYCGYTLVQVDLDEQRAAKAAAKAERRKGKVDLIGAVRSNLTKGKFNRK